MSNFILCSPASSGLSLAIAQYLFKTTRLNLVCTTRESNSHEVRSAIIRPFRAEMVRGELLSDRIKVVRIDMVNEKSMRAAAQQVPELLGMSPVLRFAWICPGVLYPERNPEELEVEKVKEMFNVNAIGPLLMLKHFGRFLPRGGTELSQHTEGLPTQVGAMWVNMSARLGSISDNDLGGWYSYRSSKAALNQITKTFDIHLKQQGYNAMCIGMHPGTVKTKLARGQFWRGVQHAGKLLMEPAEAAEKVVTVARNMELERRGRCWDYKGNEVLP
ncbi:hypothetical protein BDZ91DRAFT_343285 [Kalaharituber pfeilii]|nr:hypothetical protein BDZ91DRAFT_343285 [Kalaharituber pfeilii]